MEVQEKETIEFILGGIVHDEKTWETLLPRFLKELSRYNEDQRKRIVNDLMNIAIEEMPQQNYELFVKRIAITIGRLPDDIRYAVLTSNIISPSGLSEAKMNEVQTTLGNIMRQITAQDDESAYSIVKTVIEAMVLMPEKDGMMVMRGIVSNSLKFSKTDYIRYSTAWLNVAAGMEPAQLKKLLKLRREAIAEMAPVKQLISTDTLTKVAMLIITGDKRRKILNAVESLDK